MIVVSQRKLQYINIKSTEITDIKIKSRKLQVSLSSKSLEVLS